MKIGKDKYPQVLNIAVSHEPSSLSCIVFEILKDEIHIDAAGAMSLLFTFQTVMTGKKNFSR